MEEQPEACGEIAHTPAGIDSRLTFHETEQIFEINLADAHFRGPADVAAFYDHCEAWIAESGENLWFFLIHDDGLRVEPEAWVAYSARGRSLSLAHSMGTVRYDGSPETQAQIERARDRYLRSEPVSNPRGGARADQGASEAAAQAGRP